MTRSASERPAPQIRLSEARHFKRALGSGRTLEERYQLWLQMAPLREKYTPGLSLYLLVNDRDLPPELRPETVELEEFAHHYGVDSVGSYEFDRAWYLRWKRVGDIRIATLLGLIANHVTHTPSVALAAGVIASLWNNIKRLSEDETFVFRSMQRLTDNDVYSRWLPQDKLLQALPDEKASDDWLELLASMQSRGVLEEAGGLWRAVK